jgi:hypothetical protein
VDDIIHEDPLSESDEDKEEEDNASHLCLWHNFGEEAGDKFDDNEEDEPLARRNNLTTTKKTSRWRDATRGGAVTVMERVSTK